MRYGASEEKPSLFALKYRRRAEETGCRHPISKIIRFVYFRALC